LENTAENKVGEERAMVEKKKKLLEGREGGPLYWSYGKGGAKKEGIATS